MSSRNSTKNVGEIVIMCTIKLYVFRHCRNKRAWVGFFFQCTYAMFDHLMNKTSLRTHHKTKISKKTQQKHSPT